MGVRSSFWILMEIRPSDESVGLGHEKSPSPHDIVIGEAGLSKLKQAKSPTRAHQLKWDRSPPSMAPK